MKRNENNESCAHVIWASDQNFLRRLPLKKKDQIFFLEGLQLDSLFVCLSIHQKNPSVLELRPKKTACVKVEFDLAESILFGQNNPSTNGPHVKRNKRGDS